MARARLETEHDRTAQLMACVVNLFRDRRHGRPVKPEDLNPYLDPQEARRRRRAAAVPVGIEALKEFVR